VATGKSGLLRVSSHDKDIEASAVYGDGQTAMLWKDEKQ
jgi:hypothetical protein